MQFKKITIPPRGRSNYKIGYTASTTLPGGGGVITNPSTPGGGGTSGDGVTQAELNETLKNYATTTDLSITDEKVADHETRITKLEQGGGTGGGITEAQVDKKLENYATIERLNTTDSDVANLDRWVTEIDGTVGKKSTDPAVPSTGLVGDVDKLNQSSIATTEALMSQSQSITALETKTQENADKIGSLEKNSREFYYIHTVRTTNIADNDGVMYTVFEGPMPDTGKAEYRFCLSRLKSRKKEGKQWHIQMFSPRWNADTGEIIQPKCPSRLAWEDTFWKYNGAGNIVRWWNGTKKLSQVLDLTVDSRLPNECQFTNGNNRKQYWRVALYKKSPNYSSKGWEKVSNDCELVLYCTPDGAVHIEVKK